MLILYSFKDRRNSISIRIRISRTRGLQIYEQHTRSCFPLYFRLEAHMHRSRPSTLATIRPVLTSYHALNTREIRPVRYKETKRLPTRLK